MSEIVECPYCSAKVYQQGGFNYNETVSISCPYCGRTFELVPGFGTLTSKKPSTDRQAIHSDRAHTDGSQSPQDPVQRPYATPPPYRDPIFAEGRAIPDPRIPRREPSKPFNPTQECARAFAITAGLCVVVFILFFMLAFLRFMP